MEDVERKELTWKIKKSLHTLTVEELFQVAENMTLVPDLDFSRVVYGDEESCFDYICTYLNCKTLLELEDQGFSYLLSLRDAITKLIPSRVTEVSQPTVPEGDITQAPTLTQAVAATQGTVEINSTDTFPVDPNDPQTIEYNKLMANYEALGRKLAEFKITPPAQHTLTSTTMQSPHSRAMTSGDNSSDISYHGLCKQIEEGLKAGHPEGEIIQGVLRIIKPGQFKDMLINKDDLTLSELKSFMCSHLSEKSGSELFK